MGPSTGMFTSMDTYGGSLTDPMSLHKYLFANSNPVMYCDPSGHAPFTKEEVLESIDIQGILFNAFSEGFSYILDWDLNDPEDNSHSLLGFFFAVIGGAISGFLGGCLSTTLKVKGIGYYMKEKLANVSITQFLCCNTQLVGSLLVITIFACQGGLLSYAGDNYPTPSSSNTPQKDAIISTTLSGAGNIFTDSAYVVVSEACGLSPETLGFVVDVFKMFKEFIFS